MVATKLCTVFKTPSKSETDMIISRLLQVQWPCQFPGNYEKFLHIIFSPVIIFAKGNDWIENNVQEFFIDFGIHRGIFRETKTRGMGLRSFVSYRKLFSVRPSKVTYIYKAQSVR